MIPYAFQLCCSFNIADYPISVNKKLLRLSFYNSMLNQFQKAPYLFRRPTFLEISNFSSIFLETPASANNDQQDEQHNNQCKAASKSDSTYSTSSAISKCWGYKATVASTTTESAISTISTVHVITPHFISYSLFIHILCRCFVDRMCFCLFF